MIDRETQSRILFETLAIGSGLGIRIGEVCIACQFLCTSGQRVGRATRPMEECFVRLPRVRLGVVPTCSIASSANHIKNSLTIMPD